ncbi:hypothetical protein H6F95_18970 [Cyanobacteria bacterium FACHB-471]|nr:hypothetical protein [Cyanobacteria bacterium FACHB-471]
MRQISFIASIGMLALSLGGCALFSGGSDTAVEPSPGTTVETVEPSPGATATQPFSEPPVVNGQTSPTGTLPPDLIGSTDSDQRVQGIQRNRPDPFALLPTSPVIQTPPVVAQAPTTSSGQTGTRLPNVPSGGGGGGGGQSSRPGSLAPIPNLVPQRPAPPPRPQADLARLVKVTGVVQIGNTTHAIISAPNEPSSRYVRVGQRLSNGQILVKRIEVNAGSEPIVVLEQNGIEVVRAVGEGGAPAQPTASAIASPQVVAVGVE